MSSSHTFASFQLLDPIQRAVSEAGYTNPTPIQAQSIPQLMQGRDLLGCAQTGTGKTAAFALPILHRLASGTSQPLEKRQVRVLVLAPTRELAVQIHDSFKTYGRYLRLRSAVVFGGVSQNVQVQAIAPGVDIVVATPGRLLDLINQRCVNLSKLEVFVLDEADRMLDMGFIRDIRRIESLIPKKRHTLLFSATMPREIQSLADSFLNNPAKVAVAPVSSTATKVSQTVLFVDAPNKRNLLRHVLNNNLLHRVIVFSRTKHGANRIVEALNAWGIPSDAIHGNKSQGARQRALESFRSGKSRVLVATDIMARGIDIDDVSHVINFDIPNESESYVHRIGRTARAGASGEAISFCESEERGYLRDIEKLIGQQIPVTEDHPYHSSTAANASGAAARPKPSAQRGKRGPSRFNNHSRSRSGGGRTPPRGAQSSPRAQPSW